MLHAPYEDVPRSPQGEGTASGCLPKVAETSTNCPSQANGISLADNWEGTGESDACLLHTALLMRLSALDRDILTGSRTARFNRDLLQEGKAFGANIVPAYPGDKHACMSLIYALPATGVSLAQMEGLVRQQLESLADKGPTAAEVERIKKVTRGLVSACVQSKYPPRGSVLTWHML